MATRTSTGVKRILKEASELEADDSCDYSAGPLEDDLFNWHFTIKGPSGTDFEGGVYHGRMILPSEYPFKPPEIYMATPSGRFETNKKICLSISSFHPETWQPSWGIRTALLALMAFFETEVNLGDSGEHDLYIDDCQRFMFVVQAAGAVGSLEVPPAERRRLAQASRTFHCATCDFHATKFLTLTTTTPSSDTEDGEAVDEEDEEDEEVAAVASSTDRSDEATAIFPSSRGPGVCAADVGGHAVTTPDHVSGTADRVANASAPHPRHHHIPTAAATLDAIPAPQLRVVQHRPAPGHEPRSAAPSPSNATSASSVAAVASTSSAPAAAAAPPAATPETAALPADLMMIGGQPTAVDRLILVVLVAILALVVRKIT
ncbi:BQ5605_C022g09471 [Microbotryum silenes-dioicae]|uniref:BQ5605_C022g09471 protein n=1 Tax=Microbotryum silenes-dioicae TaxID=796604 RepID=A0A2X0MKR5_9BASI|nr:BQ5605_C022g09471 [Microbotryum silenes-dioicae]